MKSIAIICILLYLPAAGLIAQGTENNPLADSRIIRDGTGAEIVNIDHDIKVYKYFKAMSLVLRILWL